MTTAHRINRPAQRKGVPRRHPGRLFALLVAMTAAFTVIAARLTWIQGVTGNRYEAYGESQYIRSIDLVAARGAIMDRNGADLAVSVPQTTIYADPHQVTDPRGESAALAPVLDVAADKVESELTANSGFVYLARQVPDATAAAVAKLDLAGVSTLKEPKRFDPAGQLALPLLGAVDTDGNGLSGLEYRYNNLLRGKAGRLVEDVGPGGQPIAGEVRQDRAAVPGQDLVLSLDSRLQYNTEQSLAQAIVAAKARSGIAMIMNSRTGALLAVANLAMPDPTDPQTGNEPPALPPTGGTGMPLGTATPQPVQSPSASAFTQVYEPGSVTKLITISAALQQGLITPSDVLTVPDNYQVAGSTFHDAEPHPTESWTPTDILSNSSNIGTIEIAQRLGAPNLMSYLDSYGLDKRSNIGFPGESEGLLPPLSQWSGTSIATIPFGQGIAVTAIQMLAAYNTIANGGVYLPPRLLKATIGPAGHQHTVAKPAGHRVVSATVAAQMTAMLQQVVTTGTGAAAAIPPYAVAGKTGTAYVLKSGGGYQIGHYVSSFAGFAPAQNPAVTAMVVIDNTTDYAAQASAPAFATITRDALLQLNVPPSATP